MAGGGVVRGRKVVTESPECDSKCDTKKIVTQIVTKIIVSQIVTHSNPVTRFGL